MVRLYGRYWWLFIIRGILACLFGLAALVVPGITLHVLVILFAAFLIVDGGMSLAASVSGKKLDRRWWLLLIEGVLGVLIGVIAFVWPGLTILAMMVFIGFWAFITGVLEIVAAISLRNELEGEWFLGLSGVISILFSLILFSRPGAGTVAMAWLLGLYALVFGVSLILLGMKLRKHNVVVSIRNM